MSGLFPLTGEQHPAVAPGEVVWLSASAGSGKTQVLSVLGRAPADPKGT